MPATSNSGNAEIAGLDSAGLDNSHGIYILLFQPKERTERTGNFVNLDSSYVVFL